MPVSQDYICHKFECPEIHRHFIFVNNVKILIFGTNVSLKGLLPRLQVPFDLYDVANKQIQIFLNLEENVLSLRKHVHAIYCNISRL